jgi:hypothetical protein
MSLSHRNKLILPEIEQNKEPLEKIKNFTICLAVIYVFLHSLYELPISEQQKDTDSLPQIQVLNDPGSQCSIEEVVYAGSNPIGEVNFWKGDTGHAFLAIQNQNGDLNTYGYYPGIFSGTGQDEVVLNNPNDIKFYNSIEIEKKILSNKLYVDCANLPKLEELMQKTVSAMVKYKMNKNFPLPLTNNLNEDWEGVTGNCVTFLKEFFKSFKLVDQAGMTISHKIPFYDVPAAYYNLLSLTTEVNTGDLVGSGERLLAKFVSKIVANLGKVRS